MSRCAVGRPERGRGSGCVARSRCRDERLPHGGGIGGDVAAQAKAIADQSSFEQAAACAAVAQFALQEARKASEQT